MCQVLPGLCCLFWSHSETQQLSYFLGCYAPTACRVLSHPACAVVCVLADLHAHRLEAAFLILETVIHLPFLFFSGAVGEFPLVSLACLRETLLSG